MNLSPQAIINCQAGGNCKDGGDTIYIYEFASKIPIP
jgi:hypothetical protein